MLEREIKLLLDEGAIRRVVVTGSPSTSYLILINGRTVKSARRETRQFAKLDTVAAFLLKLGLNDFSVVMTVNGEANVTADSGESRYPVRP